ncbi:MAG: class I SAM-dependent methyltransferase [Pseudomonadota bacterium]
MFGNSDSYDYSCCEQCGAVFQDPMPAVEQIADFYPDEYEQYQPERVKPVKNYEKGALRAVHGYRHLEVSAVYIALGHVLGRIKYRTTPHFLAGHRALDIGCGNGKFLNKLCSLGWDAQGVEFNEGAVAVCRASGLTVSHGDLHSAGFPDASFDMVSARHVIEHIPDPNAFISEIARILRPGGQLYLRTPNSRALGRKPFGKYWYPNEVPRHLVLFASGNLTLLAGHHGLNKLRITTQSSPKAVLNSVDYAAGWQTESSKRRPLRRLLARLLYVWPATLLRRGDEIFAVYVKQSS